MSLAEVPRGGRAAKARRSLGRHGSVYLVYCPLNENKSCTNNAPLSICPPQFSPCGDTLVFVPGDTATILALCH